MPTPGLSLVGFIDDQQLALNHLMGACVPANPDPAVLIAQWTAAKAQLGAPIPFAGHPNIQPIEPGHDAYIQQVLSHPIFQPGPQGAWLGATVQSVEIDPLLAYQMTVDTDRLDHHTSTLPSPPTFDQLLQCCLPLAPTPESFVVIPGQTSMVLRARSLNVRCFQGFWRNDAMGIFFGVSIPLIHVVRHGGHCYLFNGYHRAVGLRRAGFTHIPCIVRDVADHAAVGMNPPEFFSAARLVQPDPPTVGHFTQDRAITVQLRLHSRILHVSWGEHAVPEE
jgi:hypothetical protein